MDVRRVTVTHWYWHKWTTYCNWPKNVSYTDADVLGHTQQKWIIYRYESKSVNNWCWHKWVICYCWTGRIMYFLHALRVQTWLSDGTESSHMSIDLPDFQLMWYETVDWYLVCPPSHYWILEHWPGWVVVDVLYDNAHCCFSLVLRIFGIGCLDSERIHTGSSVRVKTTRCHDVTSLGINGEWHWWGYRWRHKLVYLWLICENWLRNILNTNITL
jgi:hypothetical protein